MLEGTICHLLNHCGDPQPDRFAYCRYDFSLASAWQMPRPSLGSVGLAALVLMAGLVMLPEIL